MLPAGSIVGAQSSAPEDGRNYRPKQVELIEIINKPLLLHLVGCLYYWKTGFNSVFKGLTSARWGWQVHTTSRRYYTRKRDLVPILPVAGWAPEPVWTVAEDLVHIGIRSPDRPACSELLYRLSYSGPSNTILKASKTHFKKIKWANFESAVLLLKDCAD